MNPSIRVLLRNLSVATILVFSAAAPLRADSIPDLTYGRVLDFDYSGDTVNRKIFYYLPKSVESKVKKGQKIPALLFLHGGGQSTSTPSSAQAVTLDYMEDFLKYAEQSGKVLIFPASHIGWNMHTRYFFKSFVGELASLFPLVDADRLVLSGHSMGAMGITREFPYVNSFFSGVVGLAAGTQPQYAKDFALMTYFSTPYVQINGEKDHFKDFKPRMLAVEKRIMELEAMTGRKSKFELLFHKGGHSYNRPLTLQTIDRVFAEPRDRFPKEFETVFEARNHPKERVDPPLENVSITKAYWIEATEFSFPTAEQGSLTSTLRASVADQKISIDVAAPRVGMPDLGIKALKLTLSPELLDVRQSVEVVVNGKKVFDGIPPVTPLEVRIER